MGRLSNFGRSARPDPSNPPPSQPAPPPQLLTRPARRDELTLALRLALGARGAPADIDHVEQFLQFAGSRGIDAARAWVAEERPAPTPSDPASRNGARIGAAVLPIVSPGRTMLLLGGAPLSADSASQLVDDVCAHFAAQGIQLAQVLLDPSDEKARRLYERNGFRRVALLLYLQGSPRRRHAPPALPEGLRWVPYSPETHATFADTIARTYHGSLDCPLLNGLRDMEDVVAGHKSSGEFDPSLWTLLLDRDEPLGVLLLSPMRAADTLELVYLGLVPAARGRGLADLLVRQALASATAIGVSRLSLAVDEGNAPALHLYYRHGLKRVASKLAMMRLLQGQWR